jgi:poly(A) polymerase
MEIVSAERIRDELVKIMMYERPQLALRILSESELNKWVLPELPALQMQIDPDHHHKNVYEHSFQVLDNAIGLEQKYLGGPDLPIRLAALLHDIGKPKTRRYTDNKVTFRGHDVVGAKLVRRRLSALKFDKATINSVAKLVELHMRFFGYGSAKWSDSAVRRYAHDAGEELQRLHMLVRSDVTTKNRHKADYLAFAYDDIECRIAKLQEQEELLKIRPDLNGHEIIELLGLEKGHHDGWKIGMAYDFLLNYRIENGPKDKEFASKILLEWVGGGLTKQ